MPTSTIDGRAARRERNRLAVVDAVLDLFGDDGLEPSVEAVAARAELSERSIFRYFANRHDLREAVMRRNFDRVAPLLAVLDDQQAPLDVRVRQLSDTRLDLWAAIAGPARAARIHSPYGESVSGEVLRFRSLLSIQVETQFAPELTALRPHLAKDLVLVVNVLLSFDAWDVLTSFHGRTRAQVKRTWSYGLLKLLTTG